ncbi:hypothetical protein KCP70_20970 [Salmonella enterica subsp. enterica]|nr:hypothetical protein KCP70_20970 [Salmonella enterica subsp. enterica]
MVCVRDTQQSDNIETLDIARGLFHHRSWPKHGALRRPAGTGKMVISSSVGTLKRRHTNQHHGVLFAAGDVMDHIYRRRSPLQVRHGGAGC